MNRVLIIKQFIRRVIARAAGQPVINLRRIEAWQDAGVHGWSGQGSTGRYESGVAGPTPFEGVDVGPALLESPIVRELIAVLDRIPSLRANVLDFGCSNGLYCSVLKLNSHTAQWRYTGADINPHLIDSCRRRFEDARFEVADGNSALPFEDSSFDVVIASGVLLLVEHPAQLLAEFHRICTDWLVLGRVPVRRASPAAIYLQRLWHDWGHESHAMHVFNHADLLQQFSAAGFALEWSGNGSERYHLRDDDEPVQHMLFLLRRV